MAAKHGKRALREAVRDAAEGKLLQEDEPEDSVPPEDLDYPGEGVWTVPPHDEEDEGDGEDDEHELSDAAEKVLADLMDRLGKQAGK